MRLIAWWAVVAGCGFEHGALGPGDAVPPGDYVRMDEGLIDSTSTTITYVSHTTGMASSMSIMRIATAIVPGATYMLGVATKPYTPVSGVVGAGATWTLIADQCGARSQTGTAVYVGRGLAVSQDITILFPSAPGNAAAILGLYAGSTQLGSTAVYNAVNPAVCNITDTGVDPITYTFPIAATTGGRVVAFIATRQDTHTPGPGLVEREQIMAGSGGAAAGIAMVDGEVTTISGTFGTPVDVGAVGVELRP